eukprot:scaffold256234_cov18-Prasinocladus_malaysianus.AAC.1
MQMLQEEKKLKPVTYSSRKLSSRPLRSCAAVFKGFIAIFPVLWRGLHVKDDFSFIKLLSIPSQISRARQVKGLGTLRRWT